MPVPPIQSVPTLAELGSLREPARTASTGDATGFAALVGDQLANVQALDHEAASESRAVATGTSSDLAGALVSVERADLALQLTTQLRNKAVEAYQEIMRMQV